MEDKINFQKVFKTTIENLKKENIKPSLLLHVCCGPCFSQPVLDLYDYFDITIIYNNSNIYPKVEYDRRLNELKNFVNKKYPNIKIIEFPYDNLTYNKFISPLKDIKEGGERCKVCFHKRLAQGYAYASQNGFDYFGTVMSISRYKNSQTLNKIGEELSLLYPNTKWLFADFKKEDGYQKSLKIVKDEGMYFQHYCGCIYSYQDYLRKEQLKKEANK